ncbi:hypothetical protein EF294_07220 [Gordonia oryzae]|uniref:Uncharacterized protein n=1 Tax=Gordonia oryzae TaxID=2487349 RepID=A0A3N4GPP3_9ACTN|nr:hypothetical protein EF294_07220 [Gordonia oryzae]
MGLACRCCDHRDDLRRAVVDSDSDQPSTADVTVAISNYVGALNTADATAIGTLSRALLKQDFDRTGTASVHQQLTQAVADRGPAHDRRPPRLGGRQPSDSGISASADQV